MKQQLTSLIGFLCRNRDLDKAKSLLEEVVQKTIRPNAVTFGLLMKSLCCKGEYNEVKKLMFDMEYRSVSKAKLLSGEMKKRGIKPDVVIFNILVNHLCSEATYRMVVDGFCRIGDFDSALNIFECNGCKLDHACFVAWESLLCELCIKNGESCREALSEVIST
ncbi:hypothetical protein Bca52824_006712 [Brassica carinata]|uniref:Pentatricopeptide repeat-containing protein n=1 Tax=Brassica carinata TaxID=52824 RepID=A0A8X7W502_BRACI|nr:hypothetical protein Bca52824_006712 [Brassica carinata]